MMVVMVDGDDDGNDDVAVVVKTKNLQQNDQIKQGITSSVTTTTTVHTENLQQNDQIKQRITSSVTITTTTTVQQYRTPPLAGGNPLQLPKPGRLLPDPARKLQALVHDILLLEEGAGKRCWECAPHAVCHSAGECCPARRAATM